MRVRGVALLIGCLVASCAPDYGHSAFRCDQDHSCPSGQTCIFDRCRRADPIGDGSGDGVICGEVACQRSEQCCIGEDAQARCFEAGAACPGISALCDGEEDCAGRDLCCADGDVLTCDATCKTYACVDNSDCPLAAPTCCRMAFPPWGACSEDGC